MVHVTPPVHPGEYLREEYLGPLGLSAIGLAKRLNVPRTRIERLVREESAVTPNTALRLGRFFGTTAEFWMNLQTAYDLTVETNRTAGEISAIAPIQRAA
jgi:addiction module HigA family antidote